MGEESVRNNLERERLLRDEAFYQDLKVEKDVRKNLNKYYGDAAWSHMQENKNRHIGDLRGKTVLDLGCGRGEETIKALKNGAYVTAIDVSPKSIVHVKQWADKEGVSENLTASVMDAQALTLDDEMFDVVIGNGILHHLPYLETALTDSISGNSTHGNQSRSEKRWLCGFCRAAGHESLFEALSGNDAQNANQG